MSGSQNVILKNSGLHTFVNALSEVPSGSSLEALNTVIDRNSVVEQRRGFSQYGSTFGSLGADTAKQLINYKDVIVRHVLSKLQFDADANGDFRDVVDNGEIIEEIKVGLRLKSIEANGNLYLATKDGIKKISARNSLDLLSQGITDAGGVKALDVGVTLNFTELGFLEPNSKVAYRVVFGYKDLNENLILGVPSASTQIYNPSATSCFTDLTFSLPNKLTNQYFYQIYRTALATSDNPMVEPGDPGDEMNLVFEENITDADLLLGSISVSDITPEDFRRTGTLLYTNPVSGEGITQANEPPPFATDISVYKGYTFYGNTSTVQRSNFSVLTVEGITSNVDTFSISDNGAITTTYTFQGSIETFLADYTGSTPANYFNASPGTAKYFTIASANDERLYYVWYYQSVNDNDPILDPGTNLNGYVGIKVTILNTDTLAQIRDKTGLAIEAATDDFNVTVSTVADTVIIACSNNGPVATIPTENITNFVITSDNLGTGEDIPANKIFLPRIPVGAENGPTVSQQLEQLAKSLIRVVNAQDAIATGYYQSSFLSVPGQMLLEGRETVGPIFYLFSTVGVNFTPTLPMSMMTNNPVFSTNEVRPNRVMFSKFQQPEAVPLANFIDIGPKDRAINRIIALRDSLFILKEDGIYRLSGDIAPFSLSPFDFSVQVLAPDTAVVLNNQIYALSTQGVIVITDTGVSVISRPIENKLLEISRDGYAYKTIAFGVSYESDRAYHLWLPTIQADTFATQCFRYNTFTNTWTRWDKNGTCGIVNFGDNKLYLGSGDLNQVEKERKSLTRIDHSDREFEKDIILDGVLDKRIEIDSISNVTVGDVLYQKQFLTIDQYNRLLEKLDDDEFTTDKTYIQDLFLTPGSDIRSAIENLAIKLDADPDLALITYSSLVGDYSHNILSIVPSGLNTIINLTTPHVIKVGRYVEFNNTNTFPNLAKRYRVNAVTATSITIAQTLNFVLVPLMTPTVKTDVASFEDAQGCYNLISNQLNTDNGLDYTNYPMSNGFVEHEIIIKGINRQQRELVVEQNQKFLFGDCIVYNAINTVTIYNPQFFGDVSMDKQVREGTAIFENDNFSTFNISYASDKFPSFIDTIFNRPGIGDFGQFIYGATNWGGIAAPIPLRTYVPLEKQRCRFITVKLQHRVAREKYSLFGFSLLFRPYYSRTNK